MKRHLLRVLAIAVGVGWGGGLTQVHPLSGNDGNSADAYRSPADWNRFRGLQGAPHRPSGGPAGTQQPWGTQQPGAYEQPGGHVNESDAGRARLSLPVGQPGEAFGHPGDGTQAAGAGVRESLPSPRLRLVASPTGAPSVLSSAERMLPGPGVASLDGSGGGEPIGRGVALPSPVGGWSGGGGFGSPRGGPAPHPAIAGYQDGLPLSPWFGGFNLLYFNYDSGDNARFLYDQADPSHSRLWSADVDPSQSLGYELSVGRYLGDGRYGFGVSYLNFNPGAEYATIHPEAPGDYAVAFPGWNDLSFDPSGGGNPAGVANGGADSVFNYFGNASAYRLRRDIDVQGIELNLFHFGLLGGQRLASCCGPGLLDHLGAASRRLGLHGQHGDCGGPDCRSQCCYGFGGAGGPLAASCRQRFQLVASHGFRWFQFRDSLSFAADVDGDPGFHPTDLNYRVGTENNLFGYQLGGRFIYGITDRLNLAIGGKFGLYGNRVRYRQRMGNLDEWATYDSDPAVIVRRLGCENRLATLGELDFGLGYRICCAWTIRGGYRILGATGLATSVGSLAHDFASPDPNSEAFAGDSIVLHGGYIGAEYNW